MEAFKAVLFFLTVLFSIMLVLFFGATKLEQTLVKSTCNVWDTETNREVKFVKDYPWYADCLTKTDSGWISIYNLK